MDKDRIAGAARNGLGQAEQAFGDATGDAKTKVEGTMRSAAGRAQQLYGQAKDAASDAAGEVRDQAAGLEGLVREQIQATPYLAVAAAFGLGLLLSRRIFSRD
jgi:uncharacterized protein YjbJ (UPF0337 family)